MEEWECGKVQNGARILVIPRREPTDRFNERMDLAKKRESILLDWIVGGGLDRLKHFGAESKLLAASCCAISLHNDERRQRKGIEEREDRIAFIL